MARPEVVCYHEAGHAVAYLSRGVFIKHVAITPSVLYPAEIGAALRVEWEGSLDLTARIDEPRFEIFVTLVAPVVDEKRFGVGDRKGDKEDLKIARTLAEQVCPPEKVDAYFEEVLEEARRFADAPDKWERIERIAHRILKKVEETARGGRHPQAVWMRGEELQEWFEGKDPTKLPRR